MFRIWGGLFYQPRHQVDEIAGTMAAVELGRQYALPRVLHRARRAGEREDIGAARDHGAGARLDRRGADTLVAEPAKQLPAAGDVLAVEAAQRLGRRVRSYERRVGKEWVRTCRDWWWTNHSKKKK